MKAFVTQARSWARELPVATLLLFSAAACLAPGPWQCARHVEATSLVQIDPAAPPASSLRAGRPLRLDFQTDGSRSNRGATLRGRAWVDVRLPEPLEEFELLLQSSAASATQVLASPDGKQWLPLWSLAPRSDVEGLVTVRSPVLVSKPAANYLRIHPEFGAETTLAGLRIEGPGLVLPTGALALGFCFVALALLVARRLGVAGEIPEALLRSWCRFDAWLATVLAYLCFFRVSAPVLASLTVLAILFAGSLAFRRAPLATLLGVGVASLLALVVLPRFVERVVASQLAAAHELDVDHRMRPDGKEINADGIRFRGRGVDLAESDFVVAFLGGSFTYGWELPYEQAYPYALEGIVSGWSCRAHVRAVNMAWTSASPLLGLRLLREIGPRYRPDLVVYSLDMTDFQDDLRYEWRLRERGDFAIDRSEIVSRLLSRSFASLGIEAREAREIGELLRGTRQDDELMPVEIPPQRYFITEAPLAETRDAIERGVMQNLNTLNELSRGMEASMALIVYPRAYQYSQREASRSWDRDRYSVLGPFAREVFRYFREVEPSLPYPVVSLLPAFEGASEFPLFREDDPHWNQAGSRLAAHTVARELATRGLIPCDPPLASR